MCVCRGAVHHFGLNIHQMSRSLALKQHLHIFSYTQMNVTARGNPNVIKSMKAGRATHLSFLQQMVATHLTTLLFLKICSVTELSYFMGVDLLFSPRSCALHLTSHSKGYKETNHEEL